MLLKYIWRCIYPGQRPVALVKKAIELHRFTSYMDDDLKIVSLIYTLLTEVRGPEEHISEKLSDLWSFHSRTYRERLIIDSNILGKLTNWRLSKEAIIILLINELPDRLRNNKIINDILKCCKKEMAWEQANVIFDACFGLDNETMRSIYNQSMTELLLRR